MDVMLTEKVFFLKSQLLQYATRGLVPQIACLRKFQLLAGIAQSDKRDSK